MAQYPESLPNKGGIISAQEKNTLLPRELQAISIAATVVGRAATTLAPFYTQLNGQTFLLPRPAQSHVFPDCATLLAYKAGQAIAANYQNNPISLDIPAIAQIQELCGTPYQ
jgi:hypothetical protein